MRQVLTRSLPLLLLFAAGPWLVGCKKDAKDLPTGSLFVTVLLQGQPVVGALVTSDPSGLDATTDKSGTVLFEDVPAGLYRVSAEADLFGITTVPVDVKASTLNEVAIELRVDAAALPQVSEVIPDVDASYSIGEQVLFRARVSDKRDRPEQITVTWSSDRDGLLATLNPSADGRATFTTTKLSPGVHVITLRATNTAGLVTKREYSITIAAPSGEFVLQPLVQNPAGIRLTWSAVSTPDFRGYRILRSLSRTGPFDVIAVINNGGQNSFIDAAILYGREFSYRIALVQAGMPDQFTEVRSIFVEGPGVDVGTDLAAVLPDPARGLVYGLVRSSGELQAIGVASEKVDKRLALGRRLDGMTIAPGGGTLYAYSAGLTEVIAVDLAGFAVAAPVVLDIAAGGFRQNPTRLLALADDLLAAVESGADGRLVIYDRRSGAPISTFEVSGLAQAVVAANGTDVYVTEFAAGASVGRLGRYRLAGQRLTLVQRTDAVAVDASLMPCISRDAQYVFWGSSKYDATALSEPLGSIGEPVRGCSAGGETVVGDRQVWDATKFTIASFFPVEASAVSFFDGGRTVAAYDPTSGRVYLVPIP